MVLVDRDSEAPRIAAHLVEGEQAIEAVEGRVLDRLGGHGPGQLLEARRELLLLTAAQLQEQETPQEGEQVRIEVWHAPCRRPQGGVDRRPVGLRGCGRSTYVAAVDGEAGDHLS